MSVYYKINYEHIQFMLLNAYMVFVTEIIEFKDTCNYIILYITVEWIFKPRLKFVKYPVLGVNCNQCKFLQLVHVHVCCHFHKKFKPRFL